MPRVQAAYQRGRGCRENLAALQSVVTERSRRVTIVALVDLSEAFDFVEHPTLAAVLAKSVPLRLVRILWNIWGGSRARLLGGQASATFRARRGTGQGRTSAAHLFGAFVQGAEDRIGASNVPN